jgi:YidC/Oxa1 family membrane protein insertase
MTAVPGERSLAAGANELTLRFESPAIDGHKLAKTYTFKRGSYTVAVKHEVINQGSTALTPQLYLQLARDGNPPEGESSFYFTFTGPALYTEARSSRRSTSRTSPRAAPATKRPPTAAGWPWCSTTLPRPGSRPLVRASSAPPAWRQPRV